MESQPYKTEIGETVPVNSLVYTLRGRDDDRMVGSWKYTLYKNHEFQTLLAQLATDWLTMYTFTCSCYTFEFKTVWKINELLMHSYFMCMFNTYLLQGQLRYRMTGIIPAPYFFYIREDTGEVFIKTSLRNDKTTTYIVSSGNNFLDWLYHFHWISHLQYL